MPSSSGARVALPRVTPCVLDLLGQACPRARVAWGRLAYGSCQIRSPVPKRLMSFSSPKATIRCAALYKGWQAVSTSRSCSEFFTTSNSEGSTVSVLAHLVDERGVGHLQDQLVALLQLVQAPERRQIGGPMPGDAHGTALAGEGRAVPGTRVSASSERV